MLFCVRLSDGYFFPAPKSQFAKSDDLKETVDQCRYICDDAGVDLYTLSDATRETEEMVGLESGKPMWSYLPRSGTATTRTSRPATSSAITGASPSSGHEP
ncbi:DUF2865 domain-containing protein [Mesorhizobium sp. M0767]|uniref:DUF2865 domain-containing protein n=1 Tax=Mesorhizobium sp. M0767 TaxID=2956995 RepID=UPI00333CD2C4